MHEGFGPISGHPGDSDGRGQGCQQRHNDCPDDAGRHSPGAGVALDRRGTQPARTGRATESQSDRRLGRRSLAASIAGHGDHGDGIYHDDQPSLVLRNDPRHFDRVARFQQVDLGGRERPADPDLARTVVNGGLLAVRVHHEAGDRDPLPEVGRQGRDVDARHR